MSARVRVVDRGLQEIFDNIRDINKVFTKVGYPEGVDADGREMSDNAQIASYHEYGLGVPMRATMGPSFDKNLSKVKRLINREYNNVINGRSTPIQGIGKVGEFSTNQLKKEIRNLKEPPNTPATIAKKGSSNPLIDTSQMVNAVNHMEFKRE